ncbi:uncharacterized protein LOC106661456 [Cimex lectularius]|uniref:Uncharacterized protein n=1 Tax=Cimex lectularius TaxID=79782 RepID=A0A8I6TBC4_CIMLE|nr:uncharacterized protein LOC106661456 [Cimex lectularius]
MPQGGSFKGKKEKKKKEKPLQKKNRPIAPKKAKFEEVKKLKKIITKNVNRSLEEQIRAIATDGQKVHLSKKKDKTDVDPNKMPPKNA